VTQKGRHSTHNNNIRRTLKKWDSKVMHGQYIRSVDRQLVSEERHVPMAVEGDVKGETDSEIIAAQDQALRTKYNATKILKQEQKANADYVNNLMRQ
jgi:hypothetical protein